MKSSSPPPPPDPAKSYADQVAIDFQYAPRFAEQEYQLRQQYDPLYARQQLDLTKQLGPESADLYKQLLERIDPESAGIRRQLAGEVSGGLKQGYDLDPRMRREVEQSIRGAQVARGNYTGAAPVTAEATQTGSAASEMYQRRLSNAANFLSGVPTGTQQVQGAAGFTQGTTTPNNSFNYVNRNAGTQGQALAQQNYSNQLAAFNIKQQNNPWTQALGVLGGGIKLAGSVSSLFGG